MSDSGGDTALQLPTAPAAAPAPAATLTDEQRAFLTECETEFSYRFSDDDPEFVRQRQQGTPEPPVMVPWFSRRPWQDRGGRGGGWRGGRGGRDGGGGGGGRDFRDDRDRSGGRHYDRDRSYDRDRDRGRDYRDDRRGGGDYDRGGRDQYRGGGPGGGSGHYGGDRRNFY